MSGRELKLYNLITLTTWLYMSQPDLLLPDKLWFPVVNSAHTEKVSIIKLKLACIPQSMKSWQLFVSSPEWMSTYKKSKQMSKVGMLWQLKSHFIIEISPKLKLVADEVPGYCFLSFLPYKHTKLKWSPGDKEYL